LLIHLRRFWSCCCCANVIDSGFCGEAGDGAGCNGLASGIAEGWDAAAASVGAGGGNATSGRAARLLREMAATTQALQVGVAGGLEW